VADALIKTVVDSLVMSLTKNITVWNYVGVNWIRYKLICQTK